VAPEEMGAKALDCEAKILRVVPRLLGRCITAGAGISLQTSQCSWPLRAPRGVIVPRAHGEGYDG
jgi:hypothetical protein